MRIAIGGISHETNTFCTGLSTVENFKLGEWSEGEEIIAQHAGVRDYEGGILEAAERLSIEVAPTFSAQAQPSGTISKEAYDLLSGQLLAALRSAGKVDGYCLSLHGAGVAEGIDDLEGTLLAEIREQAGPDLPIVVTLDLHGNLTQAMLDNATALLGVHLYPHSDMYERGQEAVELLQKIVRGESKPTMHLTRLPMMIPTTTTNFGAAAEINQICWEWEKQPGVIDCAFFHGFATTDIPYPTVSVIVTTENDPALAQRISEDVAAQVWERREEFRPSLNPPDEAIRQALATEGRPVVINETSDNPGGGAPCDATHLLRAMLAAGLTDACMGFMYDPETAAQAHKAGTGATIQVRLGGKHEPLHGEPIEAEAYVKCLTDGKFIQQSPMGYGARVDLGPMARLIIGGIDVLVSSVRTQTLDAEVFLLHGIDVMRYKIVAIKSSNHFRAGFEPIAHKIIRADTPGLVSVDLTTFPFQRIARPIWPLDDPSWP
ncbi:MAG TPA: M81 family metallopeptidase [Nitrolancea sp.]